ncbi:hypothetical protein [Arthrobacter globiformis]|uniref:hypothetical protein n=1 Tax=Arthrobacter globiformis TaxID=1665 RepID=UPI00277DEE69|nr:hypothetical protein [Arthrobacter globiformis]MDQ0864775.1 hypothetical protein [Arthrobacter globiformis]
MQKNDPYSVETQLKKREIDPHSYSWYETDYSAYQGRVDESSWAGRRVYGRQVTSPWGRDSDGSVVSDIWISGALLNTLSRIPGVTVFHRLRAPGTPKVTLNTKFPIEHAVLHGSTVYLVDPKANYWSRLALHWTRKSSGRYGIGPKAHFSYNHEGLADGARRFATLPGVQQVIPLLAVKGLEEPIPADARWSPQGVGLFAVNEMMEFIGSNIVASLPHWRDNPDLRAAMIDLRERAWFTFN